MRPRRRAEEPEAPRPGYVGGLRLLYLPEYEDLVLRVPVQGLCVVDKVPQHLGVVRRGQDEGFLGPVIEDQLIRELAVLQLTFIIPVGVDVGHLPNLDLLLRVLLRHGLPPRLGWLVRGLLLPASKR